MNLKDFDFLRRKELFVLSVCLLALVFSQIALAQQKGKISEIQPYLILDHSIFEYIGLCLPIFSIILLIFHNRAGSDYWRYFGVITKIVLLLIGLQILLAILMLRLYLPLPPLNPGDLLPSTPTPVPSVTTSQPPTSAVISQFLEFFLKYRNLFLISIILLPLLFLIWLQSRSTDVSPVKQDLEEILPEDKQKPYKIKTILECYYQASIALEERGAESSPSFTPTEFSIDVVAKDLTSTSTIDGITNLFEEAKFSKHQMSTKDVECAKTYAQEIISIDWLDDEE